MPQRAWRWYSSSGDDTDGLFLRPMVAVLRSTAWSLVKFGLYGVHEKIATHSWFGSTVSYGFPRHELQTKHTPNVPREVFISILRKEGILAIICRSNAAGMV